MAKQSIQVATRTPDINDLLCGVPIEIFKKSFSEHAARLTSEEIAELKHLANSASNTHSYACMGLDIVQDVLYRAGDEKDTEKLNSASALTSLLNDLIHHANDTEVNALQCLVQHYERLVQHERQQYVEVPVIGRRKRRTLA